MKVLVIGGSGYIGSHTVEELLRRGHDVCIFARGTTPLKTHRQVSFIRGNRQNPKDLANLRSQGFDAVVDINAYKREDTLAIVQALDGYISRFVHLSSLAVCQQLAVPITEDAPMIADPNAGYAYDKAECERALRWAYTKNDFPFVSIRPTCVYGQRDYLSRENHFLKRIIAGDPIIIPDSGATPIFAVYVKDLAAVMANALTAKGVEGKSFNVSQPEIVSLKQHIQNIARLAGTEAVIASIPSCLLERLGFNLVHFPYSFPNEPLIIVDIIAARRELDFAPTPYAKALRETVEWFLEHGVDREPAIEDHFPPLIPRSREREIVERYRAAIRDVEDKLTDDWLNEALPKM